jgi:hypothetical protein
MRHPIEGLCPSTRYNSQLRVITASVEYFTFINATDTWQFVFDVDCFVMAPLVLIYQIRIKKIRFCEFASFKEASKMIRVDSRRRFYICEKRVCVHAKRAKIGASI